ncbi:MAG: SpoIID/LytB domain-containing protein [Ignavibacteriaceae bacterium]
MASIETSEVRVLIKEFKTGEFLNVESSSYLYDNSSRLAILTPESRIQIIKNSGNIRLTVNGKDYNGNKFFISTEENEGTIKINGKRYRGKIQVSSSNNTINVINVVSLEDYIKGVLAKEMPIGKNNENFEALKALAICVRTYSLKKMKDGKIYFDLYADTRDQVYGGMDAENPLSNKAVDETKKLVLQYDGQPALIYYHSTCGGYTEASENVFTKDAVPYLISIRDGDEPYCKISPRFQWEEIYEKEEIITRLKNYSLLDNVNYKLKDISITNKFESERVSELEIKVIDSDSNEKSLVIRGNEIRSILRTSDNKNILWSTLFDLSLKSNSVVLTGYGFGHGVGLCQWGAIALSRKDWNYKEILQHYYPGTKTANYND